MCDLAIRQAQPEDAKALLACLSQIGSESENLSFGPEGPGFTVAQEKEYLQGLQQAEKSVLLCAWKGDTLVGIASLNALSRRGPSGRTLCFGDTVSMGARCRQYLNGAAAGFCPEAWRGNH